MKRLFRVSGLLAAAVLAAAIVGPAPAAAKPVAGADFVQREGPNLTLNGESFRFAGTNNYYLMYSSQYMVDDVLNTAAANGFTVMRTWGWLDGAPKNGIWFQNLVGGTMTYNDGPTGLGNLDYTVAQAGKLGLKLVIPFTGNWGDFGGEDQYVAWAGGSYHDDFYTNATIKTWYKAWISHLLNHVNSITGIAYKNDPTIMTWELSNEPRCVGSGGKPRSANCTTDTITNWAAEMSTYIKSVDPKHLVSSGSEGFLNEAGSTDGVRNGSDGVDELAISKLPAIDVMSYHLYPDSWGKSSDLSWSTTWITEHIALAQSIHKPSMLGEYGWKTKATRNTIYKSWTDTVFSNRGTGALYWILSGKQDGGSLYPDYDGFTVYCPSPDCTTIANFAKEMKDPGGAQTLSPVADNDSAVTNVNIPVSVMPAANDVAYGNRNAVLPSTIDLDPATAGQQKTLTEAGIGTVALRADGSVLFTPEPTWFGLLTVPYTIQDRHSRTSNVATISFRVLPPPPPPTLMFGFESGVEGFGDSWGHPGVASQDCTWATQGSCSLQLVSGGSGVGWYQTSAIPAPPAGYTWADFISVSFDARVPATSTGSSVAITFRTGPNWDWCQGPFLWVPSGTQATYTVDLLTDVSPACRAGLADLRAINVFANDNTTVNVDNFVAR